MVHGTVGGQPVAHRYFKARWVRLMDYTFLQLNLPDIEITHAYQQAAEKNVLAAVDNDNFYGYWSVCADRIGFGDGNTFPSLDGHQMTDALLRLGQIDIVKANWDYVKTFQKPNGCLPIAILPSMCGVDNVEINGGLYKHWVPGDPLRALGPVTYIQNADVIFRYTQDLDWLLAQLPSVNLAAEYLISMMNENGCVGGAGYYVERPTRIEYDGVTQCHAADAFRRLSALNRCAGEDSAVARYQELAEKVTAFFRREFWIGDHFAEYIHPTHGLIAGHGLTDVDWSAIATGIADAEQEAILWPRLRNEERFYYGGMPTGISTRPETYEDWEFAHPDKHDLASMGRVWYIESWARARMGDAAGILDSLRRVIKVGRKNDFHWNERYHPDGDGGYTAAGPLTYCEYPANLIRIVQRFLLGVEFELDGSLTLGLTVPDEFPESGFGQELSWRERSISYFMRADKITGDYSGKSPQHLNLRPQPDAKLTDISVTIDGRPADIRLCDGMLSIELPSTGSPCQFEILGSL